MGLLDAHLNDTGFPLTPVHQLQVAQLVGDFDFAVNEECAQYDDCAALTPCVKAGKAVFHVEYALPVDKFCKRARQLGLSSMCKNSTWGCGVSRAETAPSGRRQPC